MLIWQCHLWQAQESGAWYRASRCLEVDQSSECAQRSWSRYCMKGPNDSFQGSGHRLVNCSLLQGVESGRTSCSLTFVPLLKHALLSLRQVLNTGNTSLPCLGVGLLAAPPHTIEILLDTHNLCVSQDVFKAFTRSVGNFEGNVSDCVRGILLCYIQHS